MSSFKHITLLGSENEKGYIVKTFNVASTEKLCTPTTIGTQKYGPLLAGGRFYAVNPKIGPQNAGRYRQVVVIRR